MSRRSEPYNLDQAIGFWLHLAHNKARTEAERVMAPFGVTPEQWAILVRLWQCDERSQTELANLTFRDKPSVTRLLDGLERAGYVVRGRDPAMAQPPYPAHADGARARGAPDAGGS